MAEAHISRLVPVFCAALRPGAFSRASDFPAQKRQRVVAKAAGDQRDHNKLPHFKKFNKDAGSFKRLAVLLKLKVAVDLESLDPLNLQTWRCASRNSGTLTETKYPLRRSWASWGACQSLWAMRETGVALGPAQR